MENKLPLLSICIPTYNREKYLQECLESIIRQEEFNIEDIEIIISDNASQDNTKDLVHHYQTKYTNIRYYCNKENVGPLRNFMKLPDYAIGEYVWFLSDDDMMSDIAIQETKNAIHKDNPAFILSDMF
jgi:abequosyltransferase